MDKHTEREEERTETGRENENGERGEKRGKGWRMRM